MLTHELTNFNLYAKKRQNRSKSASLFYKRIILWTFFLDNKKAIYKLKNQNEAAQNDYE